MSLDLAHEQSVSSQIVEALTFCYVNGLEPLEAAELVVRETLGWLLTMQEERCKQEIESMRQALKEIEGVMEVKQ